LSKSGNVPGLVREIDQHGMAVDLLINNAGLGDNGAFAETRSFCLQNEYLAAENRAPSDR
jgi:short-subunit dehydrogenase